MDLGNYIPAIKYGHLVDNDEMNPAIGQSVSVSLTSAQIKGMYAAPITVVSAPGAGKLIVVDSWVFTMYPTTTSYTAGGVVSLIYNSAASTAAAGTIPSVNVTTGTAGVANPFIIFGASNTSQAAPPLANTSLLLTNATAAFATGTGTATVDINYQIITL